MWKLQASSSYILIYINIYINITTWLGFRKHTENVYAKILTFGATKTGSKYPELYNKLIFLVKNLDSKWVSKRHSLERDICRHINDKNTLQTWKWKTSMWRRGHVSQTGFRNPTTGFFRLRYIFRSSETNSADILFWCPVCSITVVKRVFAERTECTTSNKAIVCFVKVWVY